MFGYKALEEDWTCDGHRYEVGVTYFTTKSFEGEDLYFYSKIHDCFIDYPFNPRIKIVEVEANVFVSEELFKEVRIKTERLKVIREIPWNEVLDKMNQGKNNIGKNNTGNNNIGNNNCGIYNKGNENIGDRNIGNYNSGYCNIGNKNHGAYNIGNNNFGLENIGDANIGRGNIGDANNGCYNKANNAYGCFNTKSATIMLFNKPTNLTFEEFDKLPASQIILGMPFIRKRCTDGYDSFLESLDRINKIERQCWWERLSYKEQLEIKMLPNFDEDIFREITGIDITKKLLNK